MIFKGFFGFVIIIIIIIIIIFFFCLIFVIKGVGRASVLGCYGRVPGFTET